jgi:2'-5' RNA ligase
MTRAFVAVRLPDVVLDAVSERVADLAIPGRPTAREQWHLTLQFLGDDVDIDAVATALEGLDASRGRVRLGRAGAFPDATRARVLWLGFFEGAHVLARIASEVAACTAPLGYESEDRAFRPHLTLARCRDATDVGSVISAIGDEPIGPEWEVHAVTVFESRRRSDGAQYFERATISLPG